jgi:hypothetical protein
MEAPQDLEPAVRQTRIAAGGLPMIYHGTTFGKLTSIFERGLCPGGPPVWQDPNLAEHVQGRVFFTLSLASASNFAYSAFLHGKGRRAGLARRAVVLRLPIGDTELYQDRRSMASGSAFATVPVPCREAAVAFPPFYELPTWEPLEAACRRKELPPLPDEYMSS